jgi:hypothetical protein
LSLRSAFRNVRGATVFQQGEVIVTKIIKPLLVGFLAFLVISCANAAGIAVSGVQVSGVNAALLKPAKPHGALILMAGGDGWLGVGADGSIQREGNQLVRTREAYAQRGFAVLVPEASIDLAAAVQMMTQYGKVTLVGTSRGTLRAANGLAAGARPSRLVLTSGFLTDESGSSENVARILGSPAALPPTLVVHHRHDECNKTSPAGVAPFLAWAGGKARVTWLDGGASEGNPCEAWAHHGFNGIDGAVVAAVSGFAAR